MLCSAKNFLLPRGTPIWNIQLNLKICQTTHIANPKSWGSITVHDYEKPNHVLHSNYNRNLRTRTRSLSVCVFRPVSSTYRSTKNFMRTVYTIYTCRIPPLDVRAHCFPLSYLLIHICDVICQWNNHVLLWSQKKKFGTVSVAIMMSRDFSPRLLHKQQLNRQTKKQNFSISWNFKVRRGFEAVQRDLKWLTLTVEIK